MRIYIYGLENTIEYITNQSVSMKAFPQEQKLSMIKKKKTKAFNDKEKSVKPEAENVGRGNSYAIVVAVTPLWVPKK